MTAVLVLFAATGPARAQTDTRPNVVFIMTDDQTVESLRVMRNVRALLREQGTTFSQTIASYPLCCPSRSTYLTGQYAHNHGVIHNAGPFGGYVRLDHSNTLPVWLQQSGYRTIHVGRYLNGYGVQNPDLTEIPPGWSDWISTLDPTTFNFRAWRMNENGQILEKPGPENPTEYQTDYLGRRAAERIEAASHSPQPFFLSLTFPAPHSGSPTDPDDPGLRTPSPAPAYRDAFRGTPLPRNPAFDEADVRDKPQIISDRPRISAASKASITENYQQELEALLSVDDAVGSVMRTLQTTGELDNTLIIFTSDNGFFHGEHRVRAEKILPYDPSARVPMILRGPGVPRGHTVRQLVSNIDWAPTIVDAARARPARLLDGRSLFELLRVPTLAWGREIVLENGQGVNSVPRYRALRNEGFLWVEHSTSGEYELYDRRKDPYELRNVEDSDAYRDVRRLLTRRLRVLTRCRGAAACSAGRPRVRLGVREQVRFGARGDAGCAGRSLVLGVGGAERRRVERVRYETPRGRTLAAARHAPLRRVIPRSRVGRAGGIVRARVTTIDGRVATYDRRVGPCS